jgi:hypothetical protein
MPPGQRGGGAVLTGISPRSGWSAVRGPRLSFPMPEPRSGATRAPAWHAGNDPGCMARPRAPPAGEDQVILTDAALANALAWSLTRRGSGPHGIGLAGGAA